MARAVHTPQIKLTNQQRTFEGRLIPFIYLLFAIYLFILFHGV